MTFIQKLVVIIFFLGLLIAGGANYVGMAVFFGFSLVCIWLDIIYKKLCGKNE